MHRLTPSESNRLIKLALRKTLIITMAITLAFAAYIQSEQKASANPLVLEGGIVVGTGIYVGAALMIAAGAGAVGYDQYGDEINAHALRAWDNGTTLAKDSMKMSVQAAQGIGNAIVNLQADYINYMETQITSLSNATTTFITPKITDVDGNYTLDTRYTTRIYLNVFSSANAFPTSQGLFKTIVFDADNNNYAHITYLNNVNPSGTSSTGGYVPAHFSQASKDLAADYHAMPKTIAGLKAILAKYGVSSQLSNVETWQANDIQVKPRMNEAWQGMKDAGLVLPVDSAIPLSKAGEPLTYNPDTDVYTGIEGNVVPHSDVSWKMPGIQWRDQSADIPTSGVYVNTPTLTGNPAHDDAIINNPAIPKTTTNIHTGTTITNPDMPAPPLTTPKPETGTTLPRLPNSGTIVPLAIFLGFFDLLRALLMYFVRMFNWIMTLPFIAEKPIDNEIYQWFRSAKILGVYPYTLITSMATFFLGFKLVKAARRFLP